MRGRTRKARGPAGRAASPCCAEAARERRGSPAQREPRLRSRAGGVGRLPGRGRPLGRESRAPGEYPRDQGGDQGGSAGRCGQSERARLGRPGRREVGSSELWAPLLSTWATSPQERPREGRISGTGSSRRTTGWGREAGPEVEGEAWRPGLGPPQPPPLAASAASSGGGGRGRKLSDLVGETPKQTAVRDRRPLASALAPFGQPSPAPGRCLRPRATSPWAGDGIPEPGQHVGSCLPCRHRHRHRRLRRRLSLPCQRWPP